MHKKITLLVKANSKKEAKSIVIDYIERYYNILYDYYEIGGRWNNELIDRNNKKCNIARLIDCIDIVKEDLLDVNAIIEENWQLLLKTKLEEDNKKIENSNFRNTMSGYYAKCYYNAVYRNLSFEYNIFNIETELAEDLPTEDLDKYYAVIVDFHN